MIVRMLLLSLIASSATGAVAWAVEVGSESVRAEAAPNALPAGWRAGTPATVPELRLPTLAQSRLAAMQQRNREANRRRVQIGINRSTVGEAVDPLPVPVRLAVPGGTVLRLNATSPNALALRVALRAGTWPEGVELRVAGSGFPDVVLVFDRETLRAATGADGVFWSAATDGETQFLELFVPARFDPSGVVLTVDSLSHLVVAPQSGFDVIDGLGDSGSCNVNVACEFASLGQAFVDAKNAVARMIYQSGGGSFTCTGTLLNDFDGATQIPWFFTAHHCLGTQAEATTLTTFWNNEAPSCMVNTNGPNTQLASGAELLYSQASTDGTLVRLNGAPPAGAVLAGWNSAPMTPATQVITVHHPAGDNKKVSRGHHSGASANVNIAGQIVTSTWRASWNQGTTEGGSSGAGLFTLGNGYQLRGGLFGGSASCGNVGQSEAAGNVDFYSRLDLIYPAIAQYIGPASGPTGDYTGQWHLASEGGRGLSLYSFSNGVLFGLWFVYDSLGRAAWYQLDPGWTAPDVASGRVVRWTGSPWGPTYDPNVRAFTEVGNFTLSFTSATQATFSYNVDGVNRTITLTKITVD